MAQTGFTPIQLYSTATAAAAPVAGNLAQGELAINVTDGKLFYKDNLGAVQTLASKGAGTIGGSTTQVQYNLSGALAGSANMTFDGTSMTLGGNPILSAGTANGVTYLNGSKVLTSGSALTFDGGSLSNTRASGSFATGSYITNIGSVSGVFSGDSSLGLVSIGSYSNHPVAFYQNNAEAMRLTSTGLTINSLTANGVVYANGSKVLTSGSALTFNGTNALTQTASSSEIYLAGGSSAAQGGFLAISRGGTNKVLIGTASNVIGGGSNTSDDLALFATADTRFFASSSEQMRLTSTSLYTASGINVGIGTSSPSTKLVAVQTLQGNSVDTGAELLMTTSTATNDRLNLNFSMNGVQARARAGIGAVALDSSGGYNCGLAFYTRNAGDGSALATTDEKMRLDSSGNLGIGTSSPAARLQVNSGANATAGLIVKTLGTSGSIQPIANFQRSDAAINLQIGYNGDNGDSFFGTTTNHNLFLITNNTERARIDSSGNFSMAAAGAIVGSRIDPRTVSTTSTATLTPDIQADDQFNLTAQAVGLTVAAPIGTPVDGNKLIIRILDNGISQTISWNATYTVIGTTLPTATTVSKMTYVGCIYNAANTRWDVVAVTTQV